ncbi:MAG: YbaN family protein [Kofleriaceae bacterium]|nr:YbaN family protein [Kofleriaceae bacterium]MCB9572739.1 YbaN family protein [Kofleriaceae bacterium]
MRPRAIRLAYLALGWAFFALGVIGAVLPLLPTTPFMLLALWAFSRGSARLERWLLHHRWFGARLRAWRQARVIPWSVKLTSWATMATSLTIMIVVSRVSTPVLIAAAALMAVGAAYIARCPSSPPAPAAAARATDGADAGDPAGADAASAGDDTR